MITGGMSNTASVLEGGEGDKLWAGFEARQGRVAHPSEIGDAVVMLSTPRMSLVNGANLMVDGGFTINEGFT
jgi:NAD(P)-dependent dehydrogenase (short-subunit alcohol dehydrogenase family)